MSQRSERTLGSLQERQFPPISSPGTNLVLPLSHPIRQKMTLNLSASSPLHQPIILTAILDSLDKFSPPVPMPCRHAATLPVSPVLFCFFPTLPQQKFVQYKVYALAADGSPEKGSLGPSGVLQAMCAQHFWKFSPQAYTRGLWHWTHISLAIDKTPKWYLLQEVCILELL
jgi:hypothetical protein